MVTCSVLDYSKCLIAQAFLLLVLFFYSPVVSACSVLVQSNDVLANVMENKQVIGTVPQNVSCSDRQKSLKVFSRTGQVFSRVLPARKDFVADLHGRWNVLFSEQSSASAVPSSNVVVEKSVPAFEFSKLQTTQQYLIKEVSSLKAQLNILNNQVPSQKALKRGITSVTGKPKNRLKGIYLQLHAFREESWDFNSISNEIKKVNNQPSQHRVQFCLPNQKLGQKWTKVFWGPFSSKAEANTIAKDLNSDAFLVFNPDCQLE